METSGVKTDNTALKLLVVDDSEDDALLLANELQLAGFDVAMRRVSNEAMLREALFEDIWDAVICDYNLPGFDGLQAVSIVREWNADVPVIFVSGAVRDRMGVEAMTQGANDYVLKTNLTRLAPALRRELEEAQGRREGRMSAQHYVSIINSASDAIITVGHTGHVVLFNRAATAVFGYQPTEIVGKRIDELIPEARRVAHEGHLKAAFAGNAATLIGHAMRGDLTGRRKSGEVFPVEVSLSRTTVEGRTHFTAIVRDVTESRKILAALRDSEARVRRHAETMEARVAERTAELEQARHEAERLARVKGDFLAHMSHEIRTPMNAVIGLAYMLEQETLPDAASDLVTKISTAGKALLEIINDVLDVSKIDAQKIVLETAPFKLQELSDHLATIMAVGAKDKDLELAFTCDPQLPPRLIGDVARLRQVLVNLTSNAIKFTAHGEIAVTLEQLSRVGDDARIRFTVRDTGVGMTAAVMEHIFAPFDQGDESTNRRYGGSGLGLYISQQLVRLMGGEISVISTPGQGSTFSFELDLAVAPEVASGADTDGAGLAGVTVLVVDDNPLSLTSAATTVSSLGWRVQTASSGAAAVNMVIDQPALQGPGALVLLDLRMPGKDGATVAAEIQAALPPDRRPQMMLLSTPSRVKKVDAARLDIFDAILDKPLQLSQLYDAQIRCYARRLGKPLPVPDSQRDDLGGLRLLVVDDSDINREVALRIFERHGARVTLAAGGEEALAWLETHAAEIDVVLMDVQMPGMDGLETVRHIRATPALSGLPVLALSAGALDTQRNAALAAGMDGFLAKPIDVEGALAMLARYRPAGEGAGGAPSQPHAGAPASVAPASVAPATLDAAKGLRSWGAPDTYRRYLRKFVEDYRDIADAIADAEPVAGGRLAHKLKGAAGSMALPALTAAAAAVENARSKTGHAPLPPDDPSLDELRRVLAETVAAIDVYAPANTSPMDTAHAPPDGTEVRTVIAPLLETLQDALALYDISAAEQGLEKLLPHLPADRLAPLQQAVKDFNTTAGLVAIKQLASEFGNPEGQQHE